MASWQIEPLGTWGRAVTKNRASRHRFSASLIGPFSDRTFYCFLVAFVGFSSLAIAAANRKTEQILADELAPRPDFAADLVPARHQPALYDLTITLFGTQRTAHHGISTAELVHLLHSHQVPGYLAAEQTGDEIVNGAHLVWAPSTTDTTGETR